MIETEEYFLIPPNGSLHDVLFVIDNIADCDWGTAGVYPADEEYYKDGILKHGSTKRVKVTTTIEEI